MARVGALGTWSLGRLTSTEPILYGFPQSRTASSRMILTGAPYILAEDANDQLSWRALGGLRILTGNDHYNAHFVLFPRSTLACVWARPLVCDWRRMPL